MFVIEIFLSFSFLHRNPGRQGSGRVYVPRGKVHTLRVEYVDDLTGAADGDDVVDEMVRLERVCSSGLV